MKKQIVFALLMGLVAAPTMAAQKGTAEYQALKEYKNKQRELRKQEKTSPAEKGKGFWQREAERSGFAGTAAMISNGIGNAIPLDKPNSEKKG